MCLSNQTALLPSSVIFIHSFRLTSFFLDPYIACFIEEKNIDPGKNDIRNEGNIESAIECQKICQAESQCNSFVYNTGKNCYLKKRAIEDSEISEAADDTTSGPKFCGE